MASSLGAPGAAREAEVAGAAGVCVYSRGPLKAVLLGLPRSPASQELAMGTAHGRRSQEDGC